MAGETATQLLDVAERLIRERGFNLDIKNPHVEEEDWGDPETLLNDLTKAEASVDSLRAELKAILTEALTR